MCCGDLQTSEVFAIHLAMFAINPIDDLAGLLANENLRGRVFDVKRDATYTGGIRRVSRTFLGMMNVPLLAGV